MAQETPSGILAQGERLQSIVGADSGQEVLGQQEDVLSPRAQGRERQRHHG